MSLLFKGVSWEEKVPKVRPIRTRFLIPHIILSPLFALPSAGDVCKLVLPEGMQEVSFFECKGITGTAEFEDE